MDLIERARDIWDRRITQPAARRAMQTDPSGGRVRRYGSYDDYVRHQGGKLRRQHGELTAHDHNYEQVVFERYAALPLARCTVLCLGARLGGEVRAFTRLGALAIGVDIEPGQRNQFVVAGDVHRLQFADGVFDVAFTNILDHILDIEAFIQEAERVLKDDGRLIVEIADVDMGRYEVRDLSDGKARAYLDSRLRLESETRIENATSFTTWSGVSLIYAKR
jgi:SAM-dependent methyltransferase